MGTNVTTAFITCPQQEKETLAIKLPFLVMIIKNVNATPLSSKSTSPSKSRFLTTRTSAGGSGHPTTSQLRESSPSSVLCPWGSMRDGTRFSSTCQISLVGPMAVITLRPWGWPSTPTAESEEFTFRIVSTPRRNYPQSSNCSCLSKSSNDPLLIYIQHIAPQEIQPRKNPLKKLTTIHHYEVNIF